MSKYSDNPYAYINAQDLETAIVKAMTYGDALRAVRKMPSVEIVRCKECKHMEIRTHPKSSEMTCPIMFATDGTSHDLWAIVQPDDYCSYGERKESE